MPPSRKVKLACCVVLPAVIALGAEYAVRSYALAPPRATPVRVAGELLAEQLFQESSQHRFDRRWMWEPRPGSRTAGGLINARAFRGTLPPLEPRPALRIVALGESATFGMNLPAANAWPAVLERKLRDRGVDAQVLNYGCIAHTLPQGVERYCAEVREWRPDVLLCCFGGRNELGVAGDGLTDLQKMALFDSVPMRLRMWMDESHFVRWVNSAFAPAKGAQASPAEKEAVRVPIEAYAQQLERLKRTAEQDGTELMVVLPGFAIASASLSDYQLSIERLAREHSLPLADVRAVMNRLPQAAIAPGGPEALFLDDAHPTARGSVVFADEILRALDEAHWIHDAQTR